jgi:hypothetical protein
MGCRWARATLARWLAGELAREKLAASEIGSCSNVERLRVHDPVGDEVAHTIAGARWGLSEHPVANRAARRRRREIPRRACGLPSPGRWTGARFPSRSRGTAHPGREHEVGATRARVKSLLPVRTRPWTRRHASVAKAQFKTRPLGGARGQDGRRLRPRIRCVGTIQDTTPRGARGQDGRKLRPRRAIDADRLAGGSQPVRGGREAPFASRRSRSKWIAPIRSKPRRSRIGADIEPAPTIRRGVPRSTASSQRAWTSAV